MFFSNINMIYTKKYNRKIEATQWTDRMLHEGVTKVISA